MAKEAARLILLVLVQLIILSWVLVGCREAGIVGPVSGTPVTALALIDSSATPSPESTNVVATQQPPSTPTSLPTSTALPEPTATPQPTATPTATPIGPCQERMPANGLTALVSLDYGLSRDYVPPNLVNLADYLPATVTLGYMIQVREIVVEPLVEMINDMLAAGLRPTIISGYRSYSAQAIAWAKWQEKHPDRASIISAPPGHSEHQLGTTIDFGSPELPELVGDEDIEFHTNFYLTSEGDWLAQHAHEYGFVLSYPRETFELTGMYYEPWHYRYVGQDTARKLKEEGVSLINHLILTQPPPCVP